MRIAERPVALVLIVLVLAFVPAVPTETRVQQGRKARTTIVLSDLHMGVGRDRAGQWHASEDFRWEKEFAAFLQAIDTDGNGATDLILNGDTFELQESIEQDCSYADADLGCTESEARGRLQRVLAAHQGEIKTLARFAGSGSNRVVFVPGDHDAALLFASVGRLVLDALAAPGGRAEIATAGYWMSDDGQSFAEHGHQIGFNPERFDSWPAPFVRRSGRQHLVRPWGEQTVAMFSDQYERYPILDNISQAGTGLKYAIAAGGMGGAGANAPRVLRYVLSITPWLQFRLDYDGGDMEPPMWDLRRIRGAGSAFLISMLPDDDRFKPLAIKALDEGQLASVMEHFTDDQLVAVCDYAAAVRRARRRMERGLTQLSWQGPAVAECPRTAETRGSAFEYFWRSRDAVLIGHLAEIAKRVQGSRVAVFLYGHSHLADRSQVGFNAINGGVTVLPPEGFSPVRNAFTPIAINGGAWQRTITPVQLGRIETERKVSEQDLLQSLTVDDLPACYSFVQIEPYSDTPVAEVRYWRPSATGGWELATGCGR